MLSRIVNRPAGPCRVLFRYPVVALAMLFAPSVDAGPCSGVRHVQGGSSPQVVAVLSAQAGHPVGVKGLFQQGQWLIYEITLGGEPGYMFFDGPARRSPRAFVWAGAAVADEYGDVLAEVRREVPNIPKHLARCFVSQVTGSDGS